MRISIPDEIIAQPGYGKKAFLIDVMVMLYQKERISLAKAAHELGMNRLEFQQLLAQRGIHLHYDLEGHMKALDKLKTPK